MMGSAGIYKTLKHMLPDAYPIRSPVLAFLSLCGLLIVGFPLQAQTFTVTNTADSGSGSPRQAVADANADGIADTIAFEAALAGQTITLTTGPLAITNALIIDGPNADQPYASARGQTHDQPESLASACA